MTKNSQEKHSNYLLRQAREQRGWSQERIARELQVSTQTVSRWERGTSFPYPHYREQLCQLFEKSAEALGLAEETNDDELEDLPNQPSTEPLAISSALARSLLSDQALPSLWYVPSRRNAFFTGREKILATLHAQLGSGRAVALTQPAALHGLGGVGKTQIALEYAYRHAQDYRAVFWMGAETEEQVVAGLLRMAEVLHLPERDDQQGVIAAVQHWLATHDRWLLIWDNIEDIEMLARYLPATSSGAVLITTRCQVLGTLARGIDLIPMGPEEGALFLLRRAKVLSPEATHEQLQQFAEDMPAQYAAAMELVNALGGLPLALDQAGAYLEETRCGVPAYLERFRKRRAALLRLRGEGVRDHPDSISTTFALALKTIAQHHPAVLDLLRVCAFLQPDAIPEELFLQGGEHLGATLQAACRDLLEWDQVVGVACSYSLLSRQAEEQTLSIHRLVQAVLLDSMDEAECEQWSRRVLAALEAVFPEIRPATKYALKKQCDQLLPHVLHYLRQIEPAEESLILASLAYKAALALHAREQYAEAEPLHLRALAIREQALGPDHPEVATSLHYLALLSWDQGKYAEAEPLHLKALHIREQALGPDHSEVASSLNNLGTLYWMQGKYAEAEPLYLRALHIREQALGPNHLRIVSLLDNLATLYRGQGRYAEAEPIHLRALHIREQALGSNHPDMASSLSNLGVLYYEQGRYAEAEPLYLRALRIWERILEPNHPDMAFPLSNLADLYSAQGRYAEAEPLYLKALHRWEQALGSDHPHTAFPLTGLANLAREQGRDTEAEMFSQRALAIRERQLGSQHPETAETLHCLALLRQKQGHLSEALSLAARALAIRRQSLGEAHPKTVVTQTLYEQLLQEQAGAQIDGTDSTIRASNCNGDRTHSLSHQERLRYTHH